MHTERGEQAQRATFVSQNSVEFCDVHLHKCNSSLHTRRPAYASASMFNPHGQYKTKTCLPSDRWRVEPRAKPKHQYSYAMVKLSRWW